MGLWKELGFYAKVAVEVMLSGKNTEDIQAESELLFLYYPVYPFFIWKIRKGVHISIYL
jgi:hypothetical protein